MNDWLSAEFEQLKASALIDGRIVSIFPSIHEGYSYIACVGPGGCEYLGKPVRRDYLVEVLAIMGIDANKGQWSIEKCSPLTMPPYTNTHPSKRPEQLVYFIEGANKIKIGIAEDPETRLETLQASSPVQLRILATCNGGIKREKELHKQFAHLRLHGEWFEGAAELTSYIKGLIDENR